MVFKYISCFCTTLVAKQLRGVWGWGIFKMRESEHHLDEDYICSLASGCMETFVSFICETFVSFIAQKVWTLWFNLRPTSIPSVASTDKNCNQWKNVAADHSDKNVTTPQHHHNSKNTTIINIATGETSQAITPFHFFDNFNFHH